MSAHGSVTSWFLALGGGDREGARKLWERFSRRLIGLARMRLQNTPRQAADEEDVALSAFDSFCRAAEEGRFAGLEDRDGLWQLLVRITTRKALDLHKHERRLKRGGGNAATGAVGLEEAASPAPGPDLAVLMAEECCRLLDLLGDPQLRHIVLARMEGYTDDEIARRLGCARRTVQRRVGLIRQLWGVEA